MARAMQPLSRSCGGDFSAIYHREITDVSNMFQNGCKFAVFPEKKKKNGTTMLR